VEEAVVDIMGQLLGLEVVLVELAAVAVLELVTLRVKVMTVVKVPVMPMLLVEAEEQVATVKTAVVI
tara:strand:- start:285 stop:485 length:201 start_codon:yes stop_codon:yes gene_type:complete